jgi:allantoinase
MATTETVADLAITAARVITPDGERRCAILIRDGVIVAVSDNAPAGIAQVAIPDNRVVLPGLVDSHVHVNEPGRTEWEGFATATAAAAAGGVTTIVDMPLNSIPATVDVPALELKRAATAGKLAVDVAFWGGAVPGNAGELHALHAAGVVGFKCFLLPSGVGEFAPLDAAGVRVAMETIAEFDGLLIAHAEDGAVIDAAPAAHGRRYADFVASRPAAAEVTAIQALLEQTQRTGCRTHIVHLSSAAALPLIRAAKAAGVPVTAETCPHYLTLRAEDVPDGATQFKCCPPIRDDANRELLWAGLADGTIDIIVSDHSPCTVAEKRLDTGDFGAAWGGIASVQLGLPAIWTQASARGIALSEVARWMAAGPAVLTGLTDRGTIATGQQADLCVFAPDERFVVDPALLRHRNPVSPYAGRELRGVVKQTWLHGVPVRDAEPRGQLARPGQAMRTQHV